MKIPPFAVRHSKIDIRTSNFSIQHSALLFILAGKINKKSTNHERRTERSANCEVRMANGEPKEVRTAKCEWRTEGGCSQDIGDTNQAQDIGNKSVYAPSPGGGNN